MSDVRSESTRPIDLSPKPAQRLIQCLGRSLMRHCPYCGGGGIFNGWFSLKKRCPHCDVLYEPEDGYLLGSYVVNIGVTAVVSVAVVIWMLFSSSLSVLQIQIAGVALAIGIPVLFYPYSVLLWITLDLFFHPPGDFSMRHRR